jgi:hypothetical protein
MEAVIAMSDPHALSAPTTLIYVVPRTHHPSDKYLVFVGAHCRSIDIRWRTENLLVISYDTAMIFSFKNFFIDSVDGKRGHAVEIRLSPRREAFSLGYD